MKRYLSHYINETTKNVAAEILNCINVDITLSPFIVEMLSKFYRQFNELENQLLEIIGTSQSIE